jgi:hypothetical protein
MSRAKSSFLHELAMETRRVAIWWGLPVVILALVPFIVLALSEIDWARFPDKAAIIGIPTILTVAVCVYEFRNLLVGHRGRNKRGG